MSNTIDSEGRTFLRLKIITPDETIFNDKVEHVILPTVDGEMGIYANHTPLMTNIKKGSIRIHSLENRLLNLYSDQGLARIKDSVLTILIHGNVNLKEEDQIE